MLHIYVIYLLVIVSFFITRKAIIWMGPFYMTWGLAIFVCKYMLLTADTLLLEAILMIESVIFTPWNQDKLTVTILFVFHLFHSLLFATRCQLPSCAANFRLSSKCNKVQYNEYSPLLGSDPYYDPSSRSVGYVPVQPWHQIRHWRHKCEEITITNKDAAGV